MRPFFVLSLLITAQARAQTPVDPSLAAYIASIKAIDNHAHPMAVVPPGGAPDTDYDALPLGGIPDFPLPWRLTLEAPIWGQAAHALAGVTAPAQALDRVGIQLEFANRIAMGAGLDSSRFRWVPFDDPLIFPLDTRLAGQTPDTRALYPLEAKLLGRYLSLLGLYRVYISSSDAISFGPLPTTFAE